MVTLDWTVAERGGVTLVECRVENDDAVDRRVRVASRLDGPVWPPRREGVPEAGWDDGGYEGTVGAGETVALGFASPAPPADPPVEVAWTERSAAGSGGSRGRLDRSAVGAGGDAGGRDSREGDESATDVGGTDFDAGGTTVAATHDGGTDDSVTTVAAIPDGETDAGAVGVAATHDVGQPSADGTTPADVVRALGDPRPPADAVPLPEPGDEGDCGSTADGPRVAASAASTVDDDGASPATGDAAAPATGVSREGEPTEGEPTGDVPADVAAWLADVADRVERGEALAEADGLTDAARGLEATDGLDGAAALVERLEVDAGQLRAVAERTGALADRAAAATDAPVGSLRRIA